MALGKRLINTGAEAACNTDSVQAFGADNAYSSNIALYQLDSDGGTTNNVPDTTTNNNGTASNVTYATGKFGNAGVFNGSSSKIDLPNNILPNNSTASSSCSFWFKSSSGNSAGDSETIIDAWSYSTSEPGWGLFMEPAYGGFPDGQLYLANYYLGGTSGGTGNVTFRDGNWHFGVVVLDFSGGTIKVYIDGNSTPVLSQTVSSANVDVFTTNAAIGYQNANPSYPRYFNGAIDQVRIFNKALTVEDIATLYAETSSTASNTNPLGEGAGVALYSLDYDASEASGYYNGTPSNVDFGVGGQINTGARFNGSSSLIAIGSPIPNTDTNVAISAWVKLNSGISGNMHITGTGITTAASEAPFRATLQYQSANTFRLFALRQVAGTYYLADNSTLTNVTMNADVWYHVVWSYNATGRQLSTFLNGTPIDANKAMSTSGGSVNDSTTVIGSFRSTSGPFFDGTIDQLRIFSSTINSTQASTLYAETACVHTATTTDNNYPTTNAAYLKLDNSALEEVSGNIGTESNVEYRFGRYGQAALFTKSLASFIDTGYTLPQSSTASFSWWMKSSTSSNPLSNDMVLITDRGTSGNYNFSAFIDGSSQNLGLVIANGSGSYFFSTPVALGDLAANWIHLVVTINGTAVKVYKDASEIQSVTSSATFSTTAGSRTVVIGREGTSTNTNNAYGGFLDQVRIFSSTLSSSQVTELYNEKPETDTSNFKAVLYEGTGGTQYISNVGMDLETNGGLVWLKGRDSARDHRLFDSVRGATKGLYSNLPNQEFTESGVDSFEANGFFLGSAAGVNANNESFVAWTWLAGGDAVLNEVGDINSQVSNSDKGFSISLYTNNGSASSRVGHGLTVDGVATAPEVCIIKKVSVSASWHFMTTVIDGSFDDLILNDTAAKSDSSLTAPTTTTFAAESGATGQSMVCYSFVSVAGYSKIGIYDGGTNGIQLPTGFKASWIMIKKYSSGTERIWYIYDTKRDGVNDNGLFANLNNAESSGTNFIDFNDTNIQINATGDGVNGSGSSYLYMAFK